jgi:hypothetical protein
MVFISGEFKVCCPRCGFIYLRSECQYEEKTGLLVCKEHCWDPWHPQDRPISGKGESLSVSDPNPEPADNFCDTSSNGKELL